MFVWNRFIFIFVAIIAIFKYGYGLDASKIKLPRGLMHMCKDWSRRYGIVSFYIEREHFEKFKSNKTELHFYFFH